MKKLLFVAILGTLVACGESTATTTPTDTAAAISADTATSALVVVDTTKVDTTKADTTKH